jgi:hypothetical protein
MPDELPAWISPDTDAQRDVENVGSQFLSLRQCPRKHCFSVRARGSFGPVVAWFPCDLWTCGTAVSALCVLCLANFLRSLWTFAVWYRVSEPRISSTRSRLSSKYSRCSNRSKGVDRGALCASYIAVLHTVTFYIVKYTRSGQGGITC